MNDPRCSHLKVVKRILQYIRGTEALGLLYSKTNEFKLVGYSDSDWCGDVDDRKSTTGCVLHGKYNIHMALKEAANCNFDNM